MLIVNGLIVLLIITAALQFAARQKSKVRSVDSQTAIPADEPLPSLELLVIGDNEQNKIDIRNVFTERCGILNLFDSKCPGCRDAAPSWTGVSEITEKGARFGVAWIGLMVNDDSAANYVIQHKLHQPAYQVVHKDAPLILHQVYVPSAIVVDQTGRIVGYRGPTPSDSMFDALDAETIRKRCPSN